MPVRLRLWRNGARNNPHFRIVATDSRKAPRAKYIEKLGSYDPHLQKNNTKRLRVNSERVKYWLAVGAQPTPTVARLLSRANLIPTPAVPSMVTAAEIVNGMYNPRPPQVPYQGNKQKESSLNRDRRLRAQRHRLLQIGEIGDMKNTENSTMYSDEFGYEDETDLNSAEFSYAGFLLGEHDGIEELKEKWPDMTEYQHYVKKIRRLADLETQYMWDKEAYEGEAYRQKVARHLYANAPESERAAYALRMKEEFGFDPSTPLPKDAEMSPLAEVFVKAVQKAANVRGIGPKLDPSNVGVHEKQGTMSERDQSDITKVEARVKQLLANNPNLSTVEIYREITGTHPEEGDDVDSFDKKKNHVESIEKLTKEVLPGFVKGTNDVLDREENPLPYIYFPRNNMTLDLELQTSELNQEQSDRLDRMTAGQNLGFASGSFGDDMNGQWPPPRNGGRGRYNRNNNDRRGERRGPVVDADSETTKTE